ncbi:MAG: carboxypeptidase-like regulatory domain-containing protein [Bryobacteraceae bacterium]
MKGFRIHLIADDGVVTMRLLVWAAVLTALVSGWAPAQTTAAVAVDGTVKDGAGLAVAGAIVTLETAAGAGQRTTATDQAGAFHFGDVAAGSYSVTVAADGFALWTANVTAGLLNKAPVAAVLQVALVTSTIEVTPPPKELAAEQLKSEEKQRVLGVFPHFLVTYDPNAAPLTARQKFHLGFKTLVDPVTLLGTGIDAGIQQAQNKYPEFGQGVEGYAKRFGARYTSHLSGVMIHHVILQAAFHQDPRYFYKDTGSFRSRVWYSIWTAFVCKGDNGRWQPDYSDVIGGAAASQVSRLYYPYTSRPWLRLFHNVLEGFGGRAEDHLLEQFVVRRFTTHTRKLAGMFRKVLAEGTAAPLVSAGDLSAGPMTFVLARDLEAGGATVAKVGAIAEGQVSYAGGMSGAGEPVRWRLEHVHLKVGNVDVPLRSNQAKGGDGALVYRQLEGSGRIALVLYVAADVVVGPGK